MARIFTRWCALATLHTLVAAAPPPIPALGWSVDELDAIMRKEGTDKSSIGHAYVNAYGPLLGPWRDQVRTLLEIGIGTLNPKQDLNMGHWSNGKHGRGKGYRPGASLRSWAQFFRNAKVIGVDIDPGAADAINAEKFPNVTAIAGDTQNPNSMRKTLDAVVPRGTVDIIIDDGLHTWEGQQQTLVTMWPYLRRGGYYFIEDVFFTWLTVRPELWRSAVASSQGDLLNLVNNEQAYKLFDTGHPVVLPVGATHPQGPAAGAMILLTKPMKHGDHAESALAAAAQLVKPECWQKTETNLANIPGMEVRDGNADPEGESCRRVRFMTLVEAQVACANLPGCGGITRDGGVACPPDFHKYVYSLRSSKAINPRSGALSFRYTCARSGA